MIINALSSVVIEFIFVGLVRFLFRTMQQKSAFEMKRFFHLCLVIIADVVC